MSQGPNAEHLEVVKQGVGAWNQWRTDHPEIRPDLNGADLRDADLRHADLHLVDLTQANLVGASLIEANLVAANLVGADLRLAKLISANFADADLRGADFSGSFLYLTEFNSTNLSGAIFRQASLTGTKVIDTDLSEALDLEITDHFGPSHIGIDTLYKSQGKIPEKFLRDAGVPEEVITELLPSIRSGSAIQWHSCFISYSSKDEEFTKRLHARMRQADMRVWFAPEDLKGGQKLHEQLFHAIQIHDRLLLVLSENSIKSEWVTTEIRKAREIERKENRRKLFPIGMIDYQTLRDWTCFDADSGKDLAIELREYFILDFSEWKNHDSFEKAFEKLQRDLQAPKAALA